MSSTYFVPPKKDASFRLCVDFRKLGAIKIRDFYRRTGMDEYTESFGEATVFSTLENNSGDSQMEFDEHDRDKAAFTSHHGLCRLIRMSFGLKNAPTTFQK